MLREAVCSFLVDTLHPSWCACRELARPASSFVMAGGVAAGACARIFVRVCAHVRVHVLAFVCGCGCARHAPQACLQAPACFNLAIGMGCIGTDAMCQTLVNIGPLRLLWQTDSESQGADSTWARLCDPKQAIEIWNGRRSQRAPSQTRKGRTLVGYACVEQSKPTLEESGSGCQGAGPTWVCLCQAQQAWCVWKVS
eukprot:364517-Chlamydomonas_euryale.AAC.2